MAPAAGLLQHVLHRLFDGLDTLLDQVDGGLERFVGGMGRIDHSLRTFGQLGRHLLGDLLGLVPQGLGLVLALAEEVAHGLADIAPVGDQVVEILAGLVHRILGTVPDAFGDAFSDIDALADQVLGLVHHRLGALLHRLGHLFGLLDGRASGLKQRVLRALGRIDHRMRSRGRRIESRLAGLHRRIRGTVDDARSRLADLVPQRLGVPLDLAEEVLDLLIALGDLVLGALPHGLGAIDGFLAPAADLLQDVADGGLNLAGQILDAVHGRFHPIPDAGRGIDRRPCAFGDGGGHLGGDFLGLVPQTLRRLLGAVEEIRDFRPDLAPVGQKIVEEADGIVEGALGPFPDAFRHTFGNIDTLADQLLGLVNRRRSLVLDAGGDALGLLQRGLDAALDRLLGLARLLDGRVHRFLAGLKGRLARLNHRIRSPVDEAGGRLADRIPKALGALGDLAERFLRLLSLLVQPLVRSLIGGLHLGDLLLCPATRLARHVGDAVSHRLGGLLRRLGRRLQTVPRSLGRLFDRIGRLGEQCCVLFDDLLAFLDLLLRGSLIVCKRHTLRFADRAAVGLRRLQKRILLRRIGLQAIDEPIDGPALARGDLRVHRAENGFGIGQRLGFLGLRLPNRLVLGGKRVVRRLVGGVVGRLHLRQAIDRLLCRIPGTKRLVVSRLHALRVLGGLCCRLRRRRRLFGGLRGGLACIGALLRLGKLGRSGIRNRLHRRSPLLAHLRFGGLIGRFGDLVALLRRAQHPRGFLGIGFGRLRAFLRVSYILLRLLPVLLGILVILGRLTAALWRRRGLVHRTLGFAAASAGIAARRGAAGTAAGRSTAAGRGRAATTTAASCRGAAATTTAASRRGAAASAAASLGAAATATTASLGATAAASTARSSTAAAATTTSGSRRIAALGAARSTATRAALRIGRIAVAVTEILKHVLDEALDDDHHALGLLHVPALEDLLHHLEQLAGLAGDLGIRRLDQRFENRLGLVPFFLELGRALVVAARLAPLGAGTTLVLLGFLERFLDFLLQRLERFLGLAEIAVPAHPACHVELVEELHRAGRNCLAAFVDHRFDFVGQLGERVARRLFLVFRLGVLAGAALGGQIVQRLVVIVFVVVAQFNPARQDDARLELGEALVPEHDLELLGQGLRNLVVLAFEVQRAGIERQLAVSALGGSGLLFGLLAKELCVLALVRSDQDGLVLVAGHVHAEIHRPGLEFAEHVFQRHERAFAVFVFVALALLALVLHRHNPAAPSNRAADAPRRCKKMWAGQSRSVRECLPPTDAAGKSFCKWLAIFSW